MLPTKGYFQDIECPFYNTTCGRPYCHFRHKRKPNENVEESLTEQRKNPVPTYKPTPKSELANIHNKNHIPISYVPDLAFKRERTVRPVRIEKPTYKPTPLSILSSATKPDAAIPENHEHKETIKDIQENIASNVYDPLKSEINFEELTSEFDLIDDIINDTDSKSQSLINKNLIKIESDIEKEQFKLNVLQSELKSDEADVKLEIIPATSETTTQKEKPREVARDIKEKPKKDHKSNKESKNHKEKVKEDIKVKHSREKSKEKERHRKEERKHSSKEKKEESKDRSKDSHKKDTEKAHKSNKREHKHKTNNNSGVSEAYSDSESSLSNSSVERKPAQPKKEKKKDSDKHKSTSKSKARKSRSRSRSRSNSMSKTKEKKPKHKSRKKSRSRSRSRHKEKKRSRSRDKKSHKHKSSHKSHSKEKDSSKSSSSKDKKEEDRKSSSPEGHLDHDDSELPKIEDDPSEYPYDINFDLEDEDETMRECYRIFNEYKPEPISVNQSEELEKKNLFEDDNSSAHQGKKRTAHAGAEISLTHSKIPPPTKPKIVPTPGQILANRYKIAKMAQASNEQENLINEIKSITQQTATKRPATSLLEAARMHKMKKLQQLKAREEQKASVNVVDDILNGVHQPGSSQVRVQPKKIAAVPNVALIEKAKERISLIKQQQVQNVKTIAQSQKSGRVAHVPEYSLSDIPDVLQAEKSKLPVNVRTRFLTMLADECFKLYASKEDSYSRALNEEFACYEKCKVLATYRNSAMLAVNRIRKEVQERESKGLGLLLSGESAATDKGSDYNGKRFYNNVRKWVLTEEELDIHGYPRESDEKGKAIINNRKPVDYSMVDENERKCSRCSKIYQVDDDGWPLYEEECMYHPLKKRTLRGEQIYLCCKSNDDTGCAMSDTHVCDGLEKHLLEGYQTTLPPESNNDPRSIAVYALDCEMCYTTKGLELTRVTIIDTDCKTVYESLVKPLNPIIDYNTRFSGITKEQMDRTSTSILQVQANILHLCNSETILVGHSLESDLKALKIVHGTIIDTSVLFPHKMGLPHKRALRALASEFLKKIIQNDVSGHDSAEDAVACMELIKWKLKEELKTRTK